MSPPSIVLGGVGKRYTKYEDAPMLVTRALRLRTRTRRSRLWALRGIDLKVAEGECVGIVGRNGSGKSTMLRMLAGVTAPTEGTVSIRGRVAPLISVGVGFHPELTGRENVYVNAMVLGLSRDAIDRRFDEIVDFAEIASFIDTPVKFYSSGMFVRLGFAVAISAEPDVLLVDEVLAVGDLAFQLKCYDRMRAIRASGTTIVVVSHNLTAIRSLCDRTAVLHDGELRFDGDTDRAISLYHDLLGEQREVGESMLPSGADRIDLAGEVVGFEMMGGTGDPTAHVVYGESVVFRLLVRFHRPVEQAIFGFSIGAETGVQVYGESVYLDSIDAHPGKVVPFEARVRMGLTTGSYTATVGLRAFDGALLVKVPRPILFFSSGRELVNGVADLHANLRLGDDPAAPH
jgi:ABC-2 type transport system ATP-binding protein